MLWLTQGISDFLIDSDTFGAEWRKEIVDKDEAYRLVLVRKGGHPGYQACFYTFPDIDEYDTGDLFKPHPTLPDYWVYAGRSDGMQLLEFIYPIFSFPYVLDVHNYLPIFILIGIIVFSNSEKLNPVTIEEQVEQHPLVKGALVIGSGRSQAGLLVEPHKQPENDNEEQQLLDSIWPSVEEVNKVTVAHGQIGRRFIMLSNPRKPLPRGGKGAIQRASTVKLYRAEIDRLYEKADEILDTDIVPINVESEHALMNSIREVFQTRLGPNGKNLDPDTGFFFAGIDSLQIMNASHLLRSSLEAAGHHVNITTRVVYSNPTLRRLAASIYSMLREGPESAVEVDDYDTETMEALWKKHVKDIPKARGGRRDPLDEGQTIILTGSTGNLGCYLLDLLIKSPVVKKVVCLNRAEDGGAKKQLEAMKERGLVSPYDGSKTTLLHANLSQPHFGLSLAVYNELLEDTDRIIHNAWPVNFNIPLESFEPQFQRLCNIAKFASGASKRVAVVFISSVGTADGWVSRKDGPVPEVRLEQMALAGIGYGQSKMIGSLIIEDAGKSGDFPAAIIRIGQIAGPEADAGCWAEHELIPSIVASSLYLKAIPSDLARLTRVDWVPVERSTASVLEIAGISQKVPAKDINGYFHVVNPTAVPWTQVAQAIQEFYGKDRIPELVSFREWVARLEKSSTRRGWDQNPGLKLLDTLRAMSAAADEPVVFDTQKTAARSPTLQATTVITPQMMKHWCKQWEF